MDTLKELQDEIRKIADAEKGRFLQRYFKTGKGEYAEGDIFIGLTVPQSRILSKKYINLSIKDVTKLLHSRTHEERQIALMILGIQFKKSDETGKLKIFNTILDNTKYINNWDLVDGSASEIIGSYLLENKLNKDYILTKLAKSKSLWERRIAILATFVFIKSGNFDETLKTAEILVRDKEDLIHKAVGWMLREGGERVSIDKEEKFLKKYLLTMPRTMLRYAIEKFPEEKRKSYLKGTI